MKVRRIVLFASLAVVVLGLDQGSKAWARTLPLGVAQPVIPGFWDWQLAKNPGAAFSTLVGGTGARVLLSIIAAAAIAAITFVAVKRAQDRLQLAAYGLIVGGAAGNLTDRLWAGEVTDFVRWRVHDHIWPVFNVADAALLVGVMLLILAGVGAKRKIAV